VAGFAGPTSSASAMMARTCCSRLIGASPAVEKRRGRAMPATVSVRGNWAGRLAPLLRAYGGACAGSCYCLRAHRGAPAAHRLTERHPGEAHSPRRGRPRARAPGSPDHAAARLRHGIACSARYSSSCICVSGGKPQWLRREFSLATSSSRVIHGSVSQRIAPAEN
jgi:hypothetical protein